MKRKLQTLVNLLKFQNAFQIFVNRLLFSKIGPTIYHFGKLKFLVDHDAGDQDGPRACVSPGLYDPFLQATRLQGNIRFIDLGANAGGFILALLKAGIGIDKGLCVELNPITWSRLVYNAYQNVPGAYHRLILLNGAISGSSGSIDIRLGLGGVGDSISGDQTGEKYTLERFTLASVFQQMGSEPVDLLKIDIEGSEYELIDGNPKCLGTVRWLIIEIHDTPDHRSEEIISWIESGGFEQVGPEYTPVESNVFLFKNERMKHLSNAPRNLQVIQ